MYRDSAGKTWWKGNLHTHSTRSDGCKTPEEVIARYRECGYDFLALTDHWVCSETEMQDGMLLLAGCEYDVGRAGLAETGIYHIVSIGAEEPPELEKSPDLKAEDIIRAIHAKNGFAILAHPAWSLTRPDDIVRLKELDAAEIYNSLSNDPWNGRRGDSSHLLDVAATYGQLLPLVASDDSHFYTGEDCKSFIWVQAEELSRESVLEALRAGRFYASQGPKMEFSMENDTLSVQCSPVQTAIFYSNLVYSSDRVQRGDGLTRASYTVRPGETFLRAELIDAEGNMAWTSPFAIREE